MFIINYIIALLLLKSLSKFLRFEPDVGSNPHHNENSIDVKEPYDIFTAATITFYLNLYYKMIVIPIDDSTPTIWPKADRTDIEFFQNIALKISNYITGFPISAEDVDTNNGIIYILIIS